MTKNALFGHFELEVKKTIVIFEIITLKFVKNKPLIHAADFGIGSTFSKSPGSAFFEDLGPDTGPVYKVCQFEYAFLLVILNKEIS